MKRYVRASSNSNDWMFRITSKNWYDFLDQIESKTGLKIDSASKRRHSNDDTILLIDENEHETYEAKYTKYSDGEYELWSYNVYQH